MPDRPAGDGLDRLAQRMERGRRTPPAPRRPVTPAEQDSSPASARPAVPDRATATDPAVADQAGLEVAVASAGSVTAQVPALATLSTPSALLAADEAQANLAVRVRRSLDRRLDDLVYELRRSGVRSSKAELVELLLWELPPTVTPELAARMARFRSVAARR